MKEIKEKYLPIGSVVILKGATKRLMISGFCALDNSNKDKIWDYSGCMYPEGFINTNQICLFDHDQIEKIFFQGFINEEQEVFMNKVNELTSNRKIQTNESKDFSISDNETPAIEV